MRGRPLWLVLIWAGAVAAVPGPMPQAPDSTSSLSLAERQNNLGAELAARGQFREAAAAFRKAVQIDALFPAAHYNLGLACARLGERAAAAASFDNARRVDPEYHDAWFQLGAMREALGDLAGAAEAFGRAASIPVPDAATGLSVGSPAGRFRQGAVCWRLGRWRDVVDVWERLLSESPGHASVARVREELPRAYFNHGVVLQAAGGADSAFAAYRRAIALRPDYAEPYQNLGILLREAGRLGESLEALKKATALQPEAPGPLSALAATYAAMDSLPDAEAAYRRLPDDSADRHTGLALVSLRRGDVPEAVNAASRAVALEPDRASAHGLLAYVYEFNTSGERYGPGFPSEDAVRTYRRALDLDPDNVLYHFNLGSIYGRLTRWDLCIEHLRRAVTLDPDHAESRKWLGVAEEARGRDP